MDAAAILHCFGHFCAVGRACVVTAVLLLLFACLPFGSRMRCSQLCSSLVSFVAQAAGAACEGMLPAHFLPSVCSKRSAEV
jgi:hypothetical protein